jgi:inosine-uridine nucleoside N-ribohydrolase
MLKKVWILDTDLGWDPDDIIALVILIQYIKISGDKVAIISSDESLENDKACTIKYIVDELLPNNDIIVAAGIKKSTNPFISKELLYYSKFKDRINTINDLCNFIIDNKKSYITWIGIGAMSNLEFILLQDIKIDKIVQMGGSLCNDIEYNIKLDPLSCKYVIDKINNSNILYFIPLDTTGYYLNWLEDKSNTTSIYERIDLNILEILQNNFPTILDVIFKNINDYIYSSSLHDPLTIIYALYEIDINIVNSFIKCEENGRWSTKINNNSIINNNYKFWWKNFNKSMNIPVSDNIYNSKISLGPLNKNQLNDFYDKMFYLLSK